MDHVDRSIAGQRADRRYEDDFYAEHRRGERHVANLKREIRAKLPANKGQCDPEGRSASSQRQPIRSQCADEEPACPQAEIGQCCGGVGACSARRRFLGQQGAHHKQDAGEKRK
jgi:hypothetical protein